MLLCSLIILVPMLMVIFGAFKSQVEAYKFDLSLPSTWQFENFVTVFKRGKLDIAFGNSIIMVLMVVPLTILISSMCSFVLARRDSKISQALYSVLSLGIIVPVCIVPTIALLQAMHLQQTRQGLALLYVAIRSSWSIFLLTGFVRSVPREMDEAALIDGCTPIRMFFSVVFPLMKPAIATCIIIMTMWTWNDFHLPLYFLSASKHRGLPLTIYYFYGENASKWNLVFADMVITSVPIIILYLFCQKYIVSGLTAGAVKG